MQRLLVVGANGYVGQRLCELLDGRYQILRISSAAKSGCERLDLRSPEAFEYDLVSVQDTIVFLAAISSPDFCRLNTEEAAKINIFGTTFFIRQALRRGARVIFFSSDLVFGASTEVADEHTLQKPYSFYGRMKSDIEREFSHCENFRVFRPSYIYSSNRFLAQLQEHTQSGLEFQIFHPIYRNAIHRDDIVAAVEAMFVNWENHDFKNINLCGTELVSRIDIAQAVARHAGLQLLFKEVWPAASVHELCVIGMRIFVAWATVD